MDVNFFNKKEWGTLSTYVQKKDGIFPSVCSLDCPDQCGLLVHKKDGKIVKVEGDPNHPITKGIICNKVRHITSRLYDQNRLAYPLKRVGKKGEGKFTRISWEEAIETIASRFQEIIEKEGPETILPYSFYGNMGALSAESLGRAFFYRLGASQLDQTICQIAGSKGYKYTMGSSKGIDPEETIHAKLIIFWGINAACTNMHQVALAQKARKNGAKIISIDIHKNQTGTFADWFIPVLPGTDGALALGIMHVLFAEHLVDENFLQKYTVGHEQLRKHVKQYDPETVSRITGVSVEDIYKLARLYGTTRPSFIRIGNGLQHHDNGGMAVRTISCLPALTGDWLLKGGGATKSNSSYLALDGNAIQRPDLLKKKNTRVINMNLIGNALLNFDPPIKGMYVYNSNPAIVAPEGNKVRKGLSREDLFLVVHDLFLTETAKYADIVLPATSSYENMDIYTSYWHHYVQLQQPVINPYGESKSNTEVFRLLAKAMGFEDEIFQLTDAQLIEKALNPNVNSNIEGITLESLQEKQYMKGKTKALLKEPLRTPSGKIELYSEKMAQDGYPPLPTYTPLVPDGEFPFLFIPTANHAFLNSTFSEQEAHRILAKEPKLVMHEEDAKKLGIEEGDLVRVWNHRGEIELRASVGTDVLPGVVVTQGLWSDDGKRFVNSLTPDRLADMGGGATFFSGRVQVEKKKDEYVL